MSKTYMRKEKGDDTSIKCVALSDWARYRQSGYVFVETDEDGNTPEQQYVSQNREAADRSDNGELGRRAREPGSGTEPTEDGVSMDNTKAEIVAYLVANDIEHDGGSTKAELLDLIE